MVLSPPSTVKGQTACITCAYGKSGANIYN
jgi:hypothetical protein